MTSPDRPAAHEVAADTGYERRDVSLRPILIAGAVVFGSVLLALVLMRGFLGVLGREEAAASAKASPLAGYGPQTPPSPRLQTDPAADIAGLRHSEDERLHTYGWTDAEHGVARLPIDRAKDLLVQRGGEGHTVKGLVLTLLLAATAVGRADPERPAALREVAFDQKLGAALPLDAAFRDEQGRTVRLGDYFGHKPVLLVPAYYQCPMLCTLVLNGVVSALRAVPFDIGREFEVVTFSIDPREQPPLAAEKKAHYLTEYRRPGAELGWHFLTGDAEQVHRLTDAIGFKYTWDEASQQYAHASGIVVATPAGTVARYFYGVEFSPRDLRLAFVEAADNKIGSLVEQLLLFCFHYDPASGRYSTAVLNGLRLAGLATLLMLGTYIVRATRTA